LYEQEQVLTRRQALAHLTDDALRHRVEMGRWQRVRSGLLVAHNGPLNHTQQLWAGVLANGDGAVLAGLPAACEGGLRRDTDGVIHVLVPAESRPLQPGRSTSSATTGMPRVVAHRTSNLTDKDVVARARPPRTTMPRSLVDAAQWATSDDEARAIVAAGCRQRLATPEQILEVVDRMPRARRRAVVLETIGFTAQGAEALSEINLVKLCRRERFPLPDHQEIRRDASGRKRYLDARWRAYEVLAEVDGGWHTEPEAWWDDMWRQNDLWIGDEIIVRFPAWAIRRQPERVAGQLRRALVRGGWRP